jgi:pimeloyl-ACP methyl ester carboxylesterase
MLPKARLAIFPEAGHLPYEEQPREFNQAVLDFLQQIS